MSNSVEEYYQLTQQPLGRMFYDIIWDQINFYKDKVFNILDFGSGFGITAKHFSEDHKVTAIEPNSLMLEKRFIGSYEQLVGGLEEIRKFPDNHFDIVFCHNVLEYCNNKKQIFKELIRVLKRNGHLSLIKHNKEGKVLHTAVFNADPVKAMTLYKNVKADYSKSFGERNVYDESDLLDWMKESDIFIDKKYGVRTFFSLIQNNKEKYNPDWYMEMLKLEKEVSTIEPYRSVSFFHHYILVKN